MSLLIKLRQNRADKVAKVTDIVETALGEDRDLTEVEETARKELMAEVEQIDSRIKLADDVAKLKGEAAQPIELTGGVDPHRTFAEPKTPEERSADLGCMVRAMAATKGIGFLAAKYAGEHLKNDRVAKALEAGSVAGGGAMIPSQLAADFIELLTPMTVVRQFVTAPWPMPNGTMDVPKITAGSNAGYIGEGKPALATGMEFGNVKAIEKKLAALVPVSNDLMRVPGVFADRIVRDDLMRSMALAEDVNFIRGTGSQYAPKGLRYWAVSGNIIPMNGTVNLVNVTADLGKLELALEQSEVKMLKPGWLFAPRTRVFLENLRDGNGNKAFPEVANGMLRGKPFKITTQIPWNLGGGSNESEIYLVDFADIVVLDSLSIELKISDQAAYHDGTTMQSAFQNDQTVIMAIAKHDLVARHAEAIAVGTALLWTP